MRLIVRVVRASLLRGLSRQVLMVLYRSRGRFRRAGRLVPQLRWHRHFVESTRPPSPPTG